MKTIPTIPTMVESMKKITNQRCQCATTVTALLICLTFLTWLIFEPGISTVSAQSVLQQHLSPRLPAAPQSTVSASPNQPKPTDANDFNDSDRRDAKSVIVIESDLPPVSILTAEPPSTRLLKKDEAQRSSNDLAHEDLDATLWVKGASEYRAITQQTFLAAASQLAAAIRDKNWSAVVVDGVPAEREFANRRRAFPVCVIVDVDETILDNSDYQRELISSGRQFSPTSWVQFAKRAASPAVPGAKFFLDNCRRLGVTVFFVTNRDVSLEAATRQNLINQRLMLSTDEDVILCKNERAEWTSGKSMRRQAIAQKYRVLLIAGDDLNDFLPVRDLSLSDRTQIADRYWQYWGRRWFMLPNPNYGSWEVAVTRPAADDSARAKRQQKLKKLFEL